MKKIATVIFLSTIAIFFAVNFARAADSAYMGLMITEIMYNPAGKNSERAKWVELANLSAKKIILYPTGSETSSGWKIKDLKITDSSSHYLYSSKNAPLEIEPGDFLIIADNFPNFSNDYPALDHVILLKSAITLTTADSSGQFHLTLSDGSSALDSIAYSKDWYPNTNDLGKSLEKTDLSADNEKESWRESCQGAGTPGSGPQTCEKEKEPDPPSGGGDDKPDDSGTNSAADTATDKDYSSSDKVRLNEIFPNPKNESDDEYIEIANGGSLPVDLQGWMLHDGSKTGKYIFPQHTTVEPGGYLAVYKSQSKIALNNSAESVNLYDPKNNLVSNVAYLKSSKGASYNFDGKSWRWSKYPTPGAENKLDSEPVVKIKMPKNIFKNIPAEFSAKAEDKETKKLKYTWDFGDGKKSRLKNTSHKYLATGKYTVKLTVRDDSQTVEKNFTLAVKNSLLPDLEIVKLVPNPTGADADGETIDLKNNSGKYVSLDGWKIATGPAEKIQNHPLSDGVVLDANETKTITHENSKFSLNNKAGKVKLISPDGKTADVVEYEKEKIAEGEAYAKIDGAWAWIDGASDETKDSAAQDAADNNTDSTINPEQTGEVLGAATENQTNLNSSARRYTSEDIYIFLNAIGLSDSDKEINCCSINQNTFSFPYLLTQII